MQSTWVSGPVCFVSWLPGHWSDHEQELYWSHPDDSSLENLSQYSIPRFGSKYSVERLSSNQFDRLATKRFVITEIVLVFFWSLSKDILLQEESYKEKEEEIYVFFLFFSSLSAKLFLYYKQRECHDGNGKFRKDFLYFLFSN